MTRQDELYIADLAIELFIQTCLVARLSEVLHYNKAYSVDPQISEILMEQSVERSYSIHSKLSKSEIDFQDPGRDSVIHKANALRGGYFADHPLQFPF